MKQQIHKIIKTIMKKNFFYILCPFLMIIFFSCKKTIDNTFNKKNVDSSDTREYFLDFYFPDTVNIKNVYEGEIIYKGVLDTITPILFVNDDTLRIVSLYIKDNTKLIKNDYEHIIKSQESDTFYPTKEKNKILFKYSFNRLGVNYLEGVLEDEVYIKTADTSALRIITNYNHITLPVFVTDDENIIDSYFKEESVKLPLTM